MSYELYNFEGVGGYADGGKEKRGKLHNKQGNSHAFLVCNKLQSGGMKIGRKSHIKR